MLQVDFTQNSAKYFIGSKKQWVARTRGDITNISAKY